MPSTVIKSFDYNPDTRILRVEFLSGNRYDYYDVPDEIFVEMKKFKSKGTFLNRFVKGNFAYSLVEKS